MGFCRLEENLIDLVKEQQAKLGFRPEVIRLYYPVSTLNHFFGSEDTAEEMKARLNGLEAHMKGTLGEVRVTAKGDRFCFLIPEEGVAYVKEHTRPNEFIRSAKPVFEKSEDGDFDWVFHFADGIPDRYYYCFKDEGCHLIYHRFLPEDYAELQ